MYIREQFKQIKTIHAEAAASTAANTPTLITGLNGSPVRVQATTGAVYVSTLTTAPTAATAWRLEDGGYLDLTVPSYLAMVSTSTAPLRQVVVFEP